MRHAISAWASGARPGRAAAWTVASSTAFGGARRSPTSTAARRILLPAVSKGAHGTTCSTSRSSAAPLRRRYASWSASPACPCPRRPRAAAHQRTSSTHTRLPAESGAQPAVLLLTAGTFWPARRSSTRTGDDGSPSCKGGRSRRPIDDRAMGSAVRCSTFRFRRERTGVLPVSGFEPQRR